MTQFRFGKAKELRTGPRFECPFSGLDMAHFPGINSTADSFIGEQMQGSQPYFPDSY
jgi:hypothetical protein